MDKTLIYAHFSSKENICYDKLIISSPTILISNFAPENEKSNIDFININDLEKNLNKLESVKYNKFIFIGADHELLPDCLLRDIFSKHITKVDFFDEELNECSYFRFKNIKSKSISCFPGPIYPINMGSHQRAFGVIKYLNDTHNYTDALITAGNENAKKISQKLLSLIAPNVYVFSNRKKKLPRLYRFRRYIENYIYNNIFKKKSPPDTFYERLYTKATFSGKKTLADLVVKNKYKNIIINYAWFYPILDMVNKYDGNLICDTHDVQYIRNRSDTTFNWRFFVNHNKDKILEIETLKKFNQIVAISQPDKEEFEKEFHNKVILASSGFDYAYIEPKLKHGKQPLNFGFIGGGMEANVIALEYALKKWWPLILNFSPKSKFYIAGSVCNSEKITELSFLNESIIKLGFVDSLSDFYNKIDISLNPVFIKGGLNFKSIESMAAGKILFTNEMGNDCIRLPNIVRIIKTEQDLIKNLVTLDRDRKFLQSQKKLSQKLALKNFSDINAYRKLVESLK